MQVIVEKSERFIAYTVSIKIKCTLIKIYIIKYCYLYFKIVSLPIADTVSVKRKRTLKEIYIINYCYLYFKIVSLPIYKFKKNSKKKNCKKKIRYIVKFFWALSL